MRGEPIRAQPKPVKREKKRVRHGWNSTLRPKGRTKHARRPRDFDYIGRVHALRVCIVRVLMPAASPCTSRFEANHIGGRYGADSDRRVVLMCDGHHADWTGRVGGGGVFAGWSPAQRRGWGRIAVAVTKSAVTGAPTRAAWAAED